MEWEQKKILVVEDETSIAEMLETVLEEEGYKVVLAENGQQGLLCLADPSINPDLVLCDVMMPVMNGIEMVRQMRSNPEYASIPVILMSAMSIPKSVSNVKHQAFLFKPFDLDSLLELIEKLLQRD